MKILRSDRGIDGTPMIIEHQKTVTLSYADNTNVRNNIGASYLFYQLRSNGLYDPDPLLLSGGISGFTEYGGFYRKYRVESVEVEWTISNNESFPVIIVFGAANSNLATVVTSSNDVLDLAENPYGVIKELSAAGGQDRITIRSKISLAQLVGQSEYYNDINYAGFLGSAPANPALLTYLLFGAVATKSTFSNGIASMIRLKFKVQLYDRQTPIDRTFLRRELDTRKCASQEKLQNQTNYCDEYFTVSTDDEEEIEHLEHQIELMTYQIKKLKT
jgi:hypothetical protein